MRKGLSIAVLVMFAVAAENMQSGTGLPSDAEIKQLREQVAKATDKFEPLLERQFYADSEQKGRQVKEMGELRDYLQKIEAEPQAFNGVLGFVFVETLHDVEDFAAGCTHVSLAGRDVELTNACHDAAILMAKAINSAQDLYARYIRAVSQRDCSQTRSDDN